MKLQGRIEVYTGPMESDKTAELIQRIKRLEKEGKKILAVKSFRDTRSFKKNAPQLEGEKKSEEYSFSSRKGISYPCIPIQLPAEIARLWRGHDVVAVDEAHLFSDDSEKEKELKDVLLWLTEKGVHVAVAGLDTDFRAEEFDIIGKLICRAGEHMSHRYTAVCKVCSSQATLSQRLIVVEGKYQPAHFEAPIIVVSEDATDDPSELKEGSERYEPRCVECHEVPGRPTFERFERINQVCRLNETIAA